MSPALLGAVRANCDGPCTTCGTLASRLDSLEAKIAKLEGRGIVRRLGVRDLMARLGIEATTTIDRMIKRGDLPAPERLPGSGRRVWTLDAIERFEHTRAAAPRQQPRGIAAVKAAARAAKEGGRG